MPKLLASSETPDKAGNSHRRISIKTSRLTESQAQEDEFEPKKKNARKEGKRKEKTLSQGGKAGKGAQKSDILKQKVVQQNVERTLFSSVCDLAMQFKSTSTDTDSAKMTHAKETKQSAEKKITYPSDLTEESSFRNEPEQRPLPKPDKEITVQNPECCTLTAKTCTASSKDPEVEQSVSEPKEIRSQTTNSVFSARRLDYSQPEIFHTDTPLTSTWSLCAGSRALPSE